MSEKRKGVGRGPVQAARHAHQAVRRLVPQTKGIDQRTVPVHICTLHITEQAATAAHHLEQPLPAMMIFWMHPEMISQIIDPGRQDGHLYPRGARVRLVLSMLLNCRCFLKCHVMGSWPATTHTASKSIKPRSLKDLPTAVKDATAGLCYA